jgi:CubicO group peptidase (beta-lactamase class C family)
MSRSSSPTTFFRRKLARLIDEHHVPGVGIAWISAGEVEHAEGYGLLQAGSGRSVRAESVFQAASLSKPVFALAVLRLASRSSIELDRPILTAGVSPPAEDRRLHAVTPRSVLRHSTGLPNWFRGGDRKMLCAPDVRFTYSGEGYVYLQRCIEKMTGIPLERWIADEVLNPAGMRHSSFVWQADFETAAASAHDETGKRTVEDRFFSSKAAGSLYTTPLDYGGFLAHLLGEDELCHQMMSSEIPVADGISWGLGWGLECHSFGTLAFHWGDNPGFQSFVLVTLDRRDAIAVFTNGQNGRLLYEVIITDWLGQRPRCLDWVLNRCRGANLNES